MRTILFTVFSPVPWACAVRDPTGVCRMCEYTGGKENLQVGSEFRIHQQGKEIPGLISFRMD